MKEEKLKELIDKYYRGESSPGEEKTLIDYLAGDEIIPGYEVEKELFSGYRMLSEALPGPSDDLEQKILRSVDKYDQPEASHFRWRYLIPLSIAASILIITGLYFFFNSRTDPADTFTDPALAYAETIKVLNEVSVKLNKGTEALQTIGKFDDATRRSIKSIDRSGSILKDNFERIKIIEKLAGKEIKTNNKEK